MMMMRLDSRIFYHNKYCLGGTVAARVHDATEQSFICVFHFHQLSECMTARSDCSIRDVGICSQTRPASRDHHFTSRARAGPRWRGVRQLCYNYCSK